MTDSRPGLLSSYRKVLDHRDLRLLLSSFVVDQVGSWAATVVLIGYVFGRTGSPTDVAILTGSRLLAGLVFGSIGGVIADRYERTRLMLGSALINGAISFGMVAVVRTDAPIFLIVILNLLSAIVGSPYRPASGALTPEIVGERELSAANSLYSTLESSVVVLGPALGALLVHFTGPSIGVLADAVTYWLAAALVFRLAIRSRGDAEPGGNPVEQWVDGLKALAGQRTAVILVMFAALDSAVYGASTDLYAPLSIRLGTGVNGYGYLLAGAALGGVIGAGLANRLSAASRLAPVLMASIALQALPFLITKPVHTPAIAFVLQVFSGVGMIIVDVLAITALQRDVPREVLSRVLGVFDVVIYASIAAAGFIGAAIFAADGLDALLVSIGIGFPAAALLGLPILLTADRASAAVAARLAPIVELLGGLDLFVGVGRPVLERLASSIEVHEYNARKVLIKEGAEADALWILVSGSLTFNVLAELDHDRPLVTVEAPDYVGEIGLLRGVPRTSTVKVKQKAVLWRISKEDFFAALEGTVASSSLASMSGRRLARTPSRTVMVPSSPLLDEGPVAG